MSPSDATTLARAVVATKRLAALMADEIDRLSTVVDGLTRRGR